MVWNDMKNVLLVVATRWSRTWPLVLAPSHQGSRPIPPEPPVGTTEAEQRYRGPRHRQGCQGQIGQEDRKIGMRMLKFNHSNDNRVIIDSKKNSSSHFSFARSESTQRAFMNLVWAILVRIRRQPLHPRRHQQGKCCDWCHMIAEFVNLQRWQSSIMKMPSARC